MIKRNKTNPEAASWRRRTFDVQTSNVVARAASGPEPPRAWRGRLQQFLTSAQDTHEGPAWWTPVDAYFGSIETRSERNSYYLDGMKRIGRRDRPLVFFQFTFAGLGHFESYGQAPQPIPPGTGFFAVILSRHRYYLPESSPGWTFAWIGLYHPYLLRRITKQVELTGPVIRALPNSPLVARLLRLVRGAFRKDFRDRFEVERALFDFTLTYEQSAEKAPSPGGAQMLEELRQRLLADLQQPIGVAELARERGMSQSAFSHSFRTQTGLTPARFILELRVQEAARLLVGTHLTLERIAEKCGFANGNHFGKVFRRLRQQSAGSYRRAVL